MSKVHEEFYRSFNQRTSGLTSDDTSSVYDTPEPLFSGDSLSKDELKKQQYLQPIRDYMVKRKGVDYADRNADEVVDDFVQHMRYFNSNTLSTATEARFVNKADQDTKEKARRAYQIYDNLGNVFVNDGVFGAIDGVKDYVFAAAKDPTNYIGLLTGGIARAGAAGVALTSKKTVQETVRRAALEAAQSGAGKQAAREAGIEAGKIAAKRAVARGATSKAADKAAEEVAKRVSKEKRRALAKKAAQSEQDKLFDAASYKALKQTIAADSVAAVAQDIMAQTTLLRAGAQENYSYLQTGFSSLLGGVAGGAQLVFGKAKGASGLAEDVDAKLEAVTNRIIDSAAPLLNKEESKKAAEVIEEAADEWNKKVERGGAFSSQTMPADLVHDIMFGTNYKKNKEIGGIAKIFKDSGKKFDRKKTISDVMTNVARNLSEEDLISVNAKLKGSGLEIGELAANKGQLGDMLAKKISDAGSTLNVMSQMRRMLDTSIVAAEESIQATLKSAEAKEAVEKELKRAEGLRYGQSVWKRMLVSSPATTAVNVFGFGQFYIGQSLADIFNSTFLYAKGLGQMYINPTEATRTFQQARVLKNIFGQKMRNLLDPYTTHDQYMKFLDQNKDISKILFETMAGGVETSAKRYNINPDGSVIKYTEAIADASAKATGVKIQDSFTKSQMFMTEMDKYLRMTKNTTLKQALTDDSIEITEDVIQAALDSTLKSVYAKDYTTDDQLLKGVAKLVESASNTPGIGFIIPFGRFMNNVVASAYQWSPLAGFSVVKNFATRSKRQGVDLTEQEAFGRFLVGSTALGLAIQYDEERQQKGLGVFEVETSGGTIIDAKNTFPFSIFLATGRAMNKYLKGEPVPRELQTEVLTQLAVGQVARDTQFGNDLLNVMDTLLNFDEGQRGAQADAFFKATGNIVAGVTRPIDFVNKTFGYIAGNDGVKDVRQAEGMNIFTQSATKYVDNIFEALADGIDAVAGTELGKDSVTGEELRVATREGEIYDPAPLTRIFGLTVKPARTATEKAYSMSDMFAFTASERTKIPAYDKIFNGFVAPILEKEIARLTNTKAYREGSDTDRRQLLKKKVSNVKKAVRKRMQEGYMGEEESRLSLAAKVSGKPKELQREAMRMAKEQFNIDGSIEDMDFRELSILLNYMDYLRDIYNTASKI